MKTLDYVLENYSKYGGSFVDRFGTRLVSFLTKEQILSKWPDIKEEELLDHKPLEWTEKNILEQLKSDVEFGIEKAMNQRGISSSLMHEVCLAWCDVLDNGIVFEDTYHDYGIKDFKAIAKFYKWKF